MLRDVAGHSVWVIEHGEGATRLLIHCSLAHAETLLPLAAAMPPSRVVAFDMPGHGRSGAWIGEDYQTDTMKIAQGLVDRPAHVIGHSFGATVALRLAVERPDLVSRLTLIEPVMFAAARGTPAYSAHQIAMEPFIAAWSAGDLDATAEAFIAMWGDGTPWADLSPRRRAMLAQQIHLIPAAAPAIEDDVHDILDRLDGVTCPVDLIEGTQSQPVMSAILDGLAARMAHTRRHVIEGAGHMVPMTHVAQVVSALERGEERIHTV